MNAICPFCGFDLQKDVPVEIDGWRYDPRGLLSRDGVQLPLTRKEFELTATLFRAHGRIVAYETLVDRLGLRDRNGISVHVRRIRAKFEQAGIAPPIGTSWGGGLFWRGAPFAAQAAA